MLTKAEHQAKLADRICESLARMNLAGMTSNTAMGRILGRASRVLHDYMEEHGLKVPADLAMVMVPDRNDPRLVHVKCQTGGKDYQLGELEELAWGESGRVPPWKIVTATVDESS